MKKNKIVPIIIGVVVVFLVILIILPFDFFENLGKNDKGYEVEQSTPEVDNSGDLESINDKIAKDNEAIGDSGEEIESESTEESTEPYVVSDASKIDSPYAYTEREHSDTSSVNDVDIDISKLDFNYNSDFERLGATAGKNATIDLIKSILIDENRGYFITVTDLVSIKKIDNYTLLCKLSKSNDDLIVIHTCGEYEDPLISFDQGRVFEYSFVIDNLSVQTVDEREVVVYVYNYDEEVRDFDEEEN